jgi:hypothetical protein
MKPSTAKAKGRETENIHVDYLISQGVLQAERRRLNGSFDQGDVTGWPGVCVEIKSGAKLDIQGWLRELEIEIKNSKAETGYVAVRPKGLPNAEDWFAVMSMPLFMELMKAAGWIPDA